MQISVQTGTGQVELSLAIIEYDKELDRKVLSLSLSLQHGNRNYITREYEPFLNAFQLKHDNVFVATTMIYYCMSSNNE